MIYVLSGVFGEPVTINKMGYGIIIYDENGNKIYYEHVDYWEKWEYDENNNMMYYEDSDGEWVKREYDERGKLIYKENSYGVIIDNRWKR